MAKPEIPKILPGDRKKLYALGGLVGVLLLVGVWNFRPSSKKPPPPPPTAKDGRVRNGDVAKKGANGSAPENVRVADAPEFGPIAELPLYDPPDSGDVTVSRNIFGYPPPPPKRVEPAPQIVKPPPPTINLGSVSPSTAVAGTSKPINVTLLGSLFPTDAQVYFNKQAIQSQRVSATAIRATIPAGLLVAAGGAQIEVKSASQPKDLWSGPVAFQLMPAPDPSETFVYSGRIGAQAVITFKEANKKPQLVTVGTTINGSVPWKILAINDKQVEMLDTRNDIHKTLGLVPKSR